jgi:hypothetical protein
MSNTLSDSEIRTQAGGVQEQGAEENTYTLRGKNKSKLEEPALLGASSGVLI